tara:strand:- start:1347 stop:1799 length:453 start_codon:yes stop_codon:yes gene_type:complete
MAKLIKLIYDRYENDIGFINEDSIEKNYIILDNIDDKLIKKDRKINIYTWGIKKHTCDKCDIIFDATLLTAKINKDVRSLNGKNDIVKQSIINHPKFEIMMETILKNIEEDEPLTIGFICNHGKHRSVAFAELLKELYYTNSKITHIGLS